MNIPIIPIVSRSLCLKLTNCLLVATTLSLASLTHGATYWVTANGSDSNSGTSQGNGWATLKHATAQVAADQGHTIRIGPGTFYDANRLSSTNTPATLPSGVNLIGAGMDQTTYVGSIYVPIMENQTISDFTLEGIENNNASYRYYKGLDIIEADNTEIARLRIQNFYSLGLVYGLYQPGIRNSTLHDCEFLNNGKHDTQGYGMRTGDLTNVEMYNNTYIEERGKGGEPWNSANRKFTNVKIYNNSYKTHRDVQAGWQAQNVFNFEFYKVDCVNVEIFNNQFDGSLSLTESDNPRADKTPFSIRVYNNRWEYTKRYAIEASQSKIVIDHNYIHFGVSLDPDEGGGYTAITGSNSQADDLLIHHNVIEGVADSAFTSLGGDNVQIFNNTVTVARPGEALASDLSTTPVFISLGNTSLTRSNWSVVNNIYRSHPDRPGKFINTDEGSYSMPSLQLFDNAVTSTASGLTSALLSSPDVEAPNAMDPDFIEYGTKPEPWFLLRTTSPAVDSGAVISGITDGYIGAAPDLGAFEGPAILDAPLLPLGTELIANGNFEQPGAATDFGPTENQGVTDWANSGTATNSVATSDEFPATGDWHAKIYFGNYNTRSIAQRTEHIIHSGDEFTLKFKYNIWSAWNPRAGARLYYEDNDQRIYFYEWVDTYNWYGNRISSDNQAQPWRTIEVTGITVPTAAVGQPIGVMFTNTVASQSILIDDVSLVRTAGPTGSTPVLVATDGFESNSWSGGSGWSDSAWTITGTANLTSGGSAGIYKAGLRNAGSSLTRNVNLGNYANVTVKVDIRRYLLEAGDTASLEFFDGSSWHTLETYSGNAGFITFEYDLSALTMNGSGQKLRLSTNFSDGNDFVYIDAVEIYGIATSSAPTPTVIATDGFESNDWTGGSGWSDNAWNTTGVCYVTTSSSEGNYSGQIRGVGSSLTRGVDLNGYTNIEISVDIRTYLLESGDTATLEFYNGSSWYTLETFSGNNGFTTYIYDLSALTMTGSNQKLRLTSGLGDNTDFAYIDAVVISGID